MENLEFKGTKGKLFPVEIAGFYVVQDGAYYEDKNVLDFDQDENEEYVSEEVRKEIAFANAKLFCAAPELLYVLQDLLKCKEKFDMLELEVWEKAESAIEKALK